ncbi:hypothetical protein PRZ48_000349 [Zasmidium cellare]|uniref:DUF3835 domain-containing protein n=1 Tax=Zasmidium cellare TaxID=395010 RepID=A0ABR0EYN5_ZASCE|nr:hypothetical protein PRZ48_000349 [Zasmidium cellare]
MDLLRLEQQRQALEQQLQILRNSLKYWQTSEAELEGLKEEIEAHSDDLNLETLSKTYNGDIVNEKEIRDIAGLDTPSPRGAQAVLGVVARRQEYVQKNIETVQRQFWDAEAKLEELDFISVSSNRDGGSGGSLPLTEIHEELDDEGNVISSSLSHPEDSTAKIVDALRKAGVPQNDLNDSASNKSAIEDTDDDASEGAAPSSLPPAIVNLDKRGDLPQTNGSSTKNEVGPNRPPIRKKSVSFSADTKPPPEPIRQESEDGKKTVSFNDKIAVMPAAPPADTRSVSFSPQVEEIPAEPAKGSEVQPDSNAGIQKEFHGTFQPGDKVHELNDDDDIVGTHIVIPEHESEEDARIRREMLDYHLHEVGHVVAQMDLEEGDNDDYETASASDFASSEYQDEDTPYTSGLSESEDENEDEFGRTKKRVVSDDYHKEMQELERRLIGNMGPTPTDQDLSSLDPEMDAGDVRRLVIREKRNSTSSVGSDGEKKTAGKKRVSFADALDVAEPSSPPLKAAKHEEGENAAPLAEVVTERTASSQGSAPQERKTSRFKQARMGPISDESNSSDVAMEDAASGGPIIADTLVERSTPKRTDAPSADETDPILQRRELAAEYYRRRNEMIRQQGGFKAPTDEDEVGELMEERDGKVKKVSRFKAARIAPSS